LLGIPDGNSECCVVGYNDGADEGSVLGALRVQLSCADDWTLRLLVELLDGCEEGLAVGVVEEY